MKEEKLSPKSSLLPIIVLILILALWALVSILHLFPESVFPSPPAVFRGFGEEIRAGRLFDDLVASLFRVTLGFALSVALPAIAPQVITALRITAGLAWVVVVAAEMIAGQDGLGFAIWDSRNGLRVDLLVVNMIVIGFIGVLIDRLLLQLTKMPSIRWGYER